MNKFELTGTLIESFPSQTFNKGFRKREFVVETGDKYPQKIMFQLVQEKCDLLDAYQVGDTLTIKFDIKGRDWADKLGTVKYFNSLEAWQVQGQKREKSSVDSRSSDIDDDNFEGLDLPPQNKPKSPVEINWSDDDLPF